MSVGRADGHAVKAAAKLSTAIRTWGLTSLWQENKPKNVMSSLTVRRPSHPYLALPTSLQRLPFRKSWPIGEVVVVSVSSVFWKKVRTFWLTEYIELAFQ